MERVTPEASWLLQRERGLAWLRLAFALVAIVVIQFNPSRLTRYPVLSATSLGVFALYSACVVAWLRRGHIKAERVGLITTCLDLVWISAIVFSTGGSRTPFFIYYLFPVITASARWGINGSLTVAAAGICVYGIIRFDLIWETSDSPLGVDTYLIRSVYLAVIAYIFGFISEFEQKQNKRLVALSKTASEAAVAEERRRIMFEIHDGILQSLATLILRVESCRMQLGDKQAALAKELGEVEDLTRSSMREIRNFLSGKIAHTITSGTLLDRLREDMRYLNKGLGLEVIVESSPEHLRLRADVEREVYLVLREALTNVTKHSHATKAEIHLAQENQHLTGSLRDDGVGFELQSRNEFLGFGLPGMEERIRKLGGELTIQSAPGFGTSVSFKLPVPEANELH